MRSALSHTVSASLTREVSFPRSKAGGRKSARKDRGGVQPPRKGAASSGAQERQPAPAGSAPKPPPGGGGPYRTTTPVQGGLASSEPNEEREGSVQRPPRGKHRGAPALQGMTGPRPGGPCQQGDHFQRRRVSRLPCNGNGDPRGGVEPSISPSAPRGGNARARWLWWKRLLINDRERARKGPAMLASRAAASTDYRGRRLAVAVEVVALGGGVAGLETTAARREGRERRAVVVSGEISRLARESSQQHGSGHKARVRLPREPQAGRSPERPTRSTSHPLSPTWGTASARDR